MVLSALRFAGYKDVTLCVGSDRLAEFNKMLDPYFGPGPEPGLGKTKGFDVHVVALGEPRDDSSASVTGMSGTKMREAASISNINAFTRGTGLKNLNARTLMSQVRNGMNTKKKMKGGEEYEVMRKEKKKLKKEQ